MKYACIIRGHLGSVVCCLLIQSQEKLAAVLKSTQFQNISSENHNDQLLSNYELFSLFHWTSCFLPILIAKLSRFQNSRHSSRLGGTSEQQTKDPRWPLILHNKFIFYHSIMRKIHYFPDYVHILNYVLIWTFFEILLDERG